MTQIIKWKQLYKVLFKDGGDPKIVSNLQYEAIKKDLFANRWIEIDNELFNPYEIKKIIKYKTQDGIVQRLESENETVKVRVHGYMKLYKHDVTLGVLENMIKKAKGEL